MLSRLRSNEALERTVARCVFTFKMIKTVLVEGERAVGGSRSTLFR
jgi:hypothetical protein